VKKDLVERIWTFFSPYREERNALLADQDRLRAILKKGADKARDVAEKTINEVRRKTGLRY
jgi:tryptophanyl-tRNA synthetase